MSYKYISRSHKIGLDQLCAYNPIYFLYKGSFMQSFSAFFVVSPRVDFDQIVKLPVI